MATLAQVTKDITRDLKKLGRSGGLNRFVAANLHTITLDRIFTKGIGGDGKKIGTYSPVTLRQKKKKGRFSGVDVNLRNTEQLVGSYIFKCNSKFCELGFEGISRNDGSTNTEVKKSLEKQYGEELFSLTKEEEGEIDNLIEDYTDKIFK